MAILAAAGMFLVLLMGANVTATGSGKGCGRTWPLCYGGLLPADSFESIVEYSHRFVTGIEGIVVAITSVGAWRLRKQHPEFKALVPLMLGTLLLQSWMGAAAVMWPQSPAVLATHFGISLVCLASAYLVARVLIDAEHADEPHRQVSATNGVRWLMIGALVASIIVAYLGAYVRHTHSELACEGWPLCQGEVIPTVEAEVGIHFVHRLGAVAITALIAGLFVAARRTRAERPDLYRIARWALILVVAQSIAGGLVVLLEVQLLTTLAHAGLMAALFMVLADGVRCSVTNRWRRPVAEPQAGMAAPATAGD
jgi:cytochrome c oxidase assembly protein subunit 15